MIKGAGLSLLKMQRRDRELVKELFSLSGQPYNKLSAGPRELSVRGWAPIRPTAAYDLTLLYRKRKTFKRDKPIKPPSLQTKVSDTLPSYMSGKLDDTYSYVYTGGLSKGTTSEPSLPQHRSLPQKATTQFPPVVYLDPVMPYHTAYQMDPQVRMDLARIIAMQLKPEFLVEQIIIESKLRKMKLESKQDKHSLNLEGVGVDPKSIPDLDRGAQVFPVKSKSSPVLPSLSTNHRKMTKPRPRRPLEWCTLNFDTFHLCSIPEITHTVSSLGTRNTTDKNILNVESSPSGTADYRLPSLKQITTHKRKISQHTSALAGDRGSLQIPVVAPSLGLGGGVRVEPEQKWQQRKVKHTNTLSSFRL